MMKYLLVILGLVLIISGCEHFADRSYSIDIRNGATYSISFYGEYIFPDTSIRIERPLIRHIASGKTNHLYDSDVGDLGFNRFEKEKLTIFIFSTDTLNKYSWGEIVIGNKVLRKYEINHDDYIRMGGGIDYP